MTRSQKLRTMESKTIANSEEFQIRFGFVWDPVLKAVQYLDTLA